MNNEKTIEALNSLVEINNDRIKGYEKASENTEERDLKDLFSSFGQNSKKCQRELISEINKIGGKAASGATASGTFFRAWMDVKNALAGKDRKAVLNSCDNGEERADETYKAVLNEESKHFSPDHKSMIQQQHSLLKSDRSKIKSLLNALAKA